MDGLRLVAELRLPVTDMGFQLSDMCYDAVHVRDGAFFRLEDHLDRWEHSRTWRDPSSHFSPGIETRRVSFDVARSVSAYEYGY